MPCARCFLKQIFFFRWPQNLFNFFCIINRPLPCSRVSRANISLSRKQIHHIRPNCTRKSLTHAIHELCVCIFASDISVQMPCIQSVSCRQFSFHYGVSSSEQKKNSFVWLNYELVYHLDFFFLIFNLATDLDAIAIAHTFQSRKIVTANELKIME